MMQRSMQRLSTGLRINSARDDAAGLAISERFTTQIKGLNQATRNAQDGISLLQTAEGNLSTVGSALQRIRELGVQAANSTNSISDKQALQEEANQLIQEINRIGSTATFNDEKIFANATSSVLGDSDQLAVVDGLKSGWLNRSESLIKEYYGIQADGADFDIEFTSFSDGAGNTAARVVGSVGATGLASNVKLQIDMEDFKPPNLPDGGTAPFYNDRIIAHEMVHAVMYRSINVGSLFANDETWFMEGTAEFIHGADERLKADYNGGAGMAAINSAIDTFGAGAGSWGGTSADYSAAYAATRFLHDEIKSNGGTGIKDLTTYMSDNKSATLDEAIQATTSYASENAFRVDFRAQAATYIAAMDLDNADTGSVGGLDADGGASRTAESVIEDYSGSSGEDQLAGFNEIWEEVASTSGPKNSKVMQVGANVGEKIQIDLGAMNTKALDIESIDLVNNFNQAILKMDRALDYVSGERAKIGGQINRMDSVIANLQTGAESMTASRSRILDTDFAKETTSLTRAQILQQAAVSVLAQANNSPRTVLELLG